MTTAVAGKPNGLVEADPTTTAEEEAPVSAVQHFGFNVMLVYIFFRFSFLHEFITGKLNIDLHIIFTLSAICYLCTLLSGRPFFAFGNKIAWFWIAFTGCMAIATVTSFWRGGSFTILMTYVRTALPIVFMIPALTITKKDLGKIISTIGLACAITVLLGLINNDFRTGRMSINQANSEIQDSNDFAAHLILMLPALAYLTLRPGKSPAYKIIGAGFIGIALFEILSTGSRGGLLSLGITTLYIAFTAGPKLRIAILLGVPLLALAAIPFIPKESAARLQTLISSTENSKAEEATESSQARLALLQESLRITARHPLFGIGPGEFMDAQAESAESMGQRGMWHVTHNSYTQVSSECGIPALLFYLAAIASTFLILWRGRKAADRDLALKCAVLHVMMVGFAICIFFLSQAYSIQFLVLGGAAIVANFLLHNEQHAATAS
ncbi:MAG TPA: O-antigen ligase family protein [Bryobacteraceae bacterium]|nr:O-antigen ligase family protein [Bryobacteraceae bacterium]